MAEEDFAMERCSAYQQLLSFLLDKSSSEILGGRIYILEENIINFRPPIIVEFGLSFKGKGPEFYTMVFELKQ